MRDGDPVPDGSRVALSADYVAKLQGWLDSQPQPRPDWGPEAPSLEWAGQVGEVVRSHRSAHMGLTFYLVRFPATKHLDAWYLRSELEATAA